jgi:hypothetical protein
LLTGEIEMKFNEAINDGLHAIAGQIDAYRENQEYDRLKGYMTDSEKIRLMKYELYSSTNARGDENHLQQLRQTILLLSNEVEREHRRRYSLPNQLNQIAKAVIGLLVLATVGSYAIHLSNICNGQNSKFCRDAGVIPNAVKRYFQEEPSLLNPEPNVNIDQSN